MKAVLAAEIGDQMVVSLTMTKDELAQAAADPRILAEAVCECCGGSEPSDDLCSGPPEASESETATACAEDSSSCESRKFIYKDIRPDDLSGDKDAVVERVMRLLIAKNDIPVDMAEIEREADFDFKAAIQSIKYDILFRGVPASEAEVDPDMLMAQIKEDLVFEKKEAFIFKKIIELMGFEASEDELYMEAEEMAARQNTTVDMVRSFFGRDLAGLAADVKNKKVRDFLYMQACFDVLCREPFFAIGCRHDSKHAADLAEDLWSCLSDAAGKAVLLMDAQAGRDYDKVIDALAPFAGEFVCVESVPADEIVKNHFESGLSAEELANLIRKKGSAATACGSVEEGIKLSLQKAAVPERMVPVVAFVSRTIAGEIRSAFSLLCKRRQRRLATARRRALTQGERDEKSRVICDKLLSLLEQPEYSKVRTIFSYRGTWEEVNVDAFNNWTEANGYRVAYPISLPHGIMKAAVPANENSWHRAAYDILEPYMEQSEILDPEDIDLIIVPCVAFDTSGNRCGHGAGYYDRFMTSVKPEALVMVAFEAQRIENLMTEKTDLPIRTIVTEEEIIRN